MLTRSHFHAPRRWNTTARETAPLPASEVSGLKVVRLDPECPQAGRRTDFRQAFGANAQKVLARGRVLCLLGQGSSTVGRFLNAVLHSVVNDTHILTDTRFAIIGLARKYSPALLRDFRKSRLIQTSYTVRRRNTTPHERQSTRATSAKRRSEAARPASAFPLCSSEHCQRPMVRNRRKILTVPNHQWTQLTYGGCPFFFTANAGRLIHETSPVPFLLGRCRLCPLAKKCQTAVRLRPMAPAQGQGW